MPKPYRMSMSEYNPTYSTSLSYEQPPAKAYGNVAYGARSRMLGQLDATTFTIHRVGQGVLKDDVICL